MPEAIVRSQLNFSTNSFMLFYLSVHIDSLWMDYTIEKCFICEGANVSVYVMENGYRIMHRRVTYKERSRSYENVWSCLYLQYARILFVVIKLFSLTSISFVEFTTLDFLERKKMFFRVGKTCTNWGWPRCIGIEEVPKNGGIFKTVVKLFTVRFWK